ncbi:hypothetical protein C0Z01_14530 [Photobacterium kishitanii]|uniref:helix-turn-helix transcriptional regulator n=1 Tax=Photobacterium kishitanii TaxID=318456 RepID=UPI0007EF3318|nr:hypothetical protein [Photobacterium kishitanii]OBU19489.1 hypothetical protein AYY22_11275 [Photobacterium kishitanii]PSW68625.1 hypothetical protein C0Z01_14530 [Photobacterium kishitanii]
MHIIYDDKARQLTRCNDIKIIKLCELAPMLGYSTKHVRHMVNDGSLPSPLRSPSGKIRGWKTKDIDEWIDMKN